MEPVRLMGAQELAHGAETGLPVNAINGEATSRKENGKRRNYLNFGSKQQERRLIYRMTGRRGCAKEEKQRTVWGKRERVSGTRVWLR
ncbi:hypothetical protein Nepgr_020496 [Nepenthes gracilis]|uniref:Uncharacterized protein n=1 Tax=Nepenthes gracilis TaxID=150966 RepID=A0AAD3SWY8_NEPGR|nr:hypothetical protein Nepgr_020496 [Nepenthes gracilis]